LGRPPRGQAPPAAAVGGRNPPPPTHWQPRGRCPCHGQRETAAHCRPPARSGPPRAGRRPHRRCRSQSRLQSRHPSRPVAAPTRHTRKRSREPRRTGLSHTRADGRSTHARRRARRGAPSHTHALPATRLAGRRAPPRAFDEGDAAQKRADHGEPCAPVGLLERPVPTGKEHSCHRAVATTAARRCCAGVLHSAVQRRGHPRSEPGTEADSAMACARRLAWRSSSNNEPDGDLCVSDIVVAPKSGESRPNKEALFCV